MTLNRRAREAERGRLVHERVRSRAVAPARWLAAADAFDGPAKRSTYTSARGHQAAGLTSAGATMTARAPEGTSVYQPEASLASHTCSYFARRAR